MERVSIREIEYLARLAGLMFDSEEKEQLAREMEQILDFMDQLNELDTAGIEPLSHPLQLVNAMRNDRPAESLPVEDALKNAPFRIGHFFKVPKVIR